VNDDLLSIGRFALATGLTVKALRYYDELGLLRPACVDGSTGYRYYSPEQLRDGEAVCRLRRLEVPLDEIGALIRAGDVELRSGLAAHRERMAASAAVTQQILAELDRLIVGEEELVTHQPMEIELVEEPELRLAAVMKHVHLDDINFEMSRLIDEVASWVVEHGGLLDMPVGVFRPGDGDEWLIVEVGWPVSAEIEGDARVGVYTHPAGRAASHIHRGDYEDLHPVVQRFLQAVWDRGLRPSQPNRIVYHTDPARQPDRSQWESRLVWPLD
jgi:DNA-binding transcriptional MerR regulator